MRLINRPCTITRRWATGEIDDDGLEEIATDEVETVCEFQPTQSREPVGEGEFSQAEWDLFLGPNELIDTSDAVVIDGRIYEVTGEPERWRNPRTRQFVYIRATVRRAGETEGS